MTDVRPKRKGRTAVKELNDNFIATLKDSLMKKFLKEHPSLKMLGRSFSVPTL